MKQQPTTAEHVTAIAAAQHTATHSNASGGAYTDTETTVRYNETANRVWVDIRCVGNLQWWEQPTAEQLRSWVDELIQPLGMKREGARVPMTAPKDSWRFMYSVVPRSNQQATITWPEHLRGKRVEIVNQPGNYNVIVYETGEPLVIHPDNLDFTTTTSKEETAEQLTPVSVVFRYETSYSSSHPVTAVFADGEPREREFRTIYNHEGQHSSGNRGWYENNTRPATAEEYAPLLQELQAIGYAVTPVLRVKWSK